VWVGVGAVAAVVAGLLIYATVQAGQGSTAEVLTVTGTADSRELKVVFGPCGMDWRASVEETSDTVTVKVLLDGRRSGDCDLVAAIATLTLDSPLGDRRVVDAATGHTVRVEGRG